jgi:peptidyl-prolyl cis-trans isomerase D
MLEAQVKAEKKAKLIADKYKGQNVDAIAQASTQPVQPLDSFNAASNYLPNLGYEPKVVGYSFFDGFKPNTTSPAIKGTDGVFFISLVNRMENTNAKADPMQQQQQTLMQTMQLKNSINNSLQQTLLRNAEIKYSAKNLY